MKMKVVFNDNSWVVGETYFHWKYRETFGTHHLKISDASEENRELIGEKLAVVINNIKYFVLELN